ncbi:MAG: T9SS type A sorting domain-containing protein [Saprospiraceae bacterium]|nr:T9SS type A sorting domain-containing protein [Saprospiraceae bacterium]
MGENWLNISSGLPPGYVSSVKLSASSTEKCFVTLSTKQQNNYTSHVYASYDAGQHWKDIHGNLPNVPVYDIFVYPGRSDSLLFVGTDIGVYATITAGATWERLGDDMPFIPVFDIDLDSDKNRLIAGTFARGVQTFSLTELVKKYAVGTEETVHSTPIEWISTLVDSELKINFSSEGEHTLKIIDAGGRIISQKIVQGKIVNWNISELESGVYFLQMQNAAIKKFVKI